MKFKEIFEDVLTEGRNDYEIYHDSYTSAVEEALAFSKKQGYSYDDEEVSDIVGMNSQRPKRGKTTRVQVPLYKGQKQSKWLNFQVYNRDTDRNTFELNAYVS